MPDYSLHSRGLLIVSAGVFILSFDALLVRLAATSAENVVFWRGAFTFIALALLLAANRRSRPNLKPAGWLIANAVVAGVGLLLFPLSVTHTSRRL